MDEPKDIEAATRSRIKALSDRVLLSEVQSYIVSGQTVGAYEMMLLEELQERYWIAKGRFD